MFVTVQVDADDVIEELDDATLKEAYEKRIGVASTPDLLESIYQHFRGRSDNPECLREFMYRSLGRIL
jgi:NifB/MoaA-like Fe-S oxidoreductase